MCDKPCEGCQDAVSIEAAAPIIDAFASELTKLRGDVKAIGMDVLIIMVCVGLLLYYVAGGGDDA